MIKYRVGFVTERGGGGRYNHNYISSCSCGTVKLLGELNRHTVDRTTFSCDGCGNTRFVRLTGSKKRAVTPYIHATEKSRRGFKAKRINLSVFYDKDFNVLVKENTIYDLHYDIPDKSILLFKNDVEIILKNQYGDYGYAYEEAMRNYFRSVEWADFKAEVSCHETASMFDFMWAELSSKGYSNQRIQFGLPKLFDYAYMQILSNAGFTNVKRFHERTWGRQTQSVNIKGTNPRDILGVPKFVLKYLRENEDVGIYEVKMIRKALEKVDGNRFRELMEIVKDESTIKDLCNSLDYLMEIYNNYGYSNIKKLTLYLFREIRLMQGIDSPRNGATLLRDYLKMATELGYEVEKYPKSLKKEHDIMMMNYKVIQSEAKKQKFLEAVESSNYKGLEYKKKRYSIITPSELDDLVKEGNELSHCVASYVNSIVDGQCQILFLRDTENIKQPLATVEVRGNNVRQAHGYANRKLARSEAEFVNEWAEEKQLAVNYYY